MTKSNMLLAMALSLIAIVAPGLAGDSRLVRAFSLGLLLLAMLMVKRGRAQHAGGHAQLSSRNRLAWLIGVGIFYVVGAGLAVSSAYLSARDHEKGFGLAVVAGMTVLGGGIALLVVIVDWAVRRRRMANAEQDLTASDNHRNTSPS